MPLLKSDSAKLREICQLKGRMYLLTTFLLTNLDQKHREFMCMLLLECVANQILLPMMLRCARFARERTQL